MRRTRLLLAVLTVLAPLAVPAGASALPTDLDAAFGTGGIAAAPFTQGGSSAADVAVAPNGKIVAVGQRVLTSNSHHQWVAARWLAGGQPDTTFNGNGRTQPLTADIVDSPVARGALALAVGSTGNLFVVGQANGTDAPIQIAKVTGDGSPSDGQLDASFGSAGVAAIALPGSTRTFGRAIRIQPDGKILVAGHGFVSGHEVVFVARFLTTGQPDPFFDDVAGAGTGVVTVPAASCDDVPSADCYAHALAITVSGGEVHAIYVGGLNGGDLVGGRVWKFVPGSGQDGFALAGAGWGDGVLPGAAQIQRQDVNEVAALIPQIDGSMVAAGYAQSGPSFQCGIVRLTPIGTPDTAFGAGGAGRINAGGTCVLRDLVQQADGRFLFTGEDYTGTFTAGNESTVTGRFTANGLPDETFAAGGATVLDPGGAPSDGQAVALQNGQPLVAGFAGSPAVMRTARLTGGDLLGLPVAGAPGDSGAALPKNLTPPTIVGLMVVGAPAYCTPGAWTDAAGFRYTWERINVDGSATQVSLEQVYVPVGLDSGHKLRCTVIARSASGGQRASGAFNEPVVALRAGIVSPPAVQLAMPRLVERADPKVCKKRVCEVPAVLEYFRDKGLPVQFKEIAEDPDSFPSNVHDVTPEMVFKQVPAPGTKLTSIGGAPQKITLTVYRPKIQPRRCPIDRPIRAGDESFTLSELVTGQSLTDAENLLKVARCVKVKRGGDETDSDYSVDLHPSKGVFEPVVTGTHSDSVKGQKIIVLEVRYPADQLAFVIEPDDTPGVLTLSLGKPELTVDKKHVNRIVVAPMTPSTVGFRNAFVELRDENGQQLDGAFTGADGRATLHALIDHKGTYTVVARVADRNGETLTGVQDIAAVDRLGKPWVSAAGTTFAGSAAAGYKATAAAHVAAFTAAQEDAQRAALQPIFASLDRVLRAQNLNLTKGQRDTMDTVAVLSDAYRFGAHTYAQFVKDGFSVAFLALGGSGTLQAGTTSLLTTPGIVSDGTRGYVQRVNAIKPGSGVLSLRFQRAGAPVLIVYPGGTYAFQTGGGNIPGATPSAVTLDATSASLNIAPLIGNDGASLIGNDGAGLIGNDGAGLITNDGGSLIGNDGASIVATGGGNLGPSKSAAAIVATGGGNIVATGGGNIVAAGGGNIVATGGGNLALQGAGLIGNDGAG